MEMGISRQGSNCGFYRWVVVIGGEHRGVIAREGWTKKQVKGFLYQKAQQSVAELKRWGKMSGVVEPGDNKKMVAGA